MGDDRAAGYILGQLALVGSADVIGFGSPSFRVEKIRKGLAESLIKSHHYSGAVVWSSHTHLGVFAGDAIIGVLQFGPAMNPASGGKVVKDCRPEEWCELNRMWLAADAPAQSASRAIGYAVKYLRRARPAITWLQSFADERCGKWGGVYQASSFIYLGAHASTFYELDGEWFHKSMVGRAQVDKRGWSCGAKIARFNANIERATPHTFRQFRYVRMLTNGARRRLIMEPKPYPKPSQEAGDDAA